MVPNQDVRQRIAQIVERLHGVRFEEIEDIMSRIGIDKPKIVKSGWVYKIPGTYPLLLCVLPDGSGTLPAHCVANFRDRMTDLKLYE